MYTRRQFIKQIGAGSAGFVLLSNISHASLLHQPPGAQTLPRSSPEAQGVSSEALLRFLTAIENSGQEFHSIMIVRNGHVIAEGWWAPYSAEHKQQTYSFSKSFTSTAIGFAADENLLSVEDPVITFFPDLLPSVISENLAALKVKHLLSMSVGHAKDSILFLEQSPKGTPWAKTFLSLPVVEAPGSKFMYNSGASFMLAAIVTKVTGKTAHEYLTPRLFEPLGITGSTWTTNPDGINMGASHLRMKTEDMAKFGQLYLQKGKWKGQQILSEAWINAATSRQISTGNNNSSWGYGYGYQFWLNPPGGFRADGAYGQYSMVLPEQHTVVTITSESMDKEKTMHLVWDNLLPAMQGSALPANKAQNNNLQLKLKALAYEPPKGQSQSPLAKTISGKTFMLEKNPFNAKSVSFRFDDNKCIFTLKEDDKRDIVITNGMNHWIRKDNRKPEAHSLFSLRRIDFDSIVAASATWKDEKTLLITWRFIETVHGDSLTCSFEGDQVKINFLFSVPRLENKPDERSPVTGKMIV